MSLKKISEKGKSNIPIIAGFIAIILVVIALLIGLRGWEGD